MMGETGQQKGKTQVVEFFKISLAGIKIEIECLYKDIFYKCENYLDDFSTPQLRISNTKAELEAESLSYLPFEKIYEGVATTRLYGESENLLVLKKISSALPDFDTFLMHGSVVALDNYAYMFTAPSGVGKTTRTKIFLDLYPDSIVVNGDKPLIKVTAYQAIACGTPWCGKEGWNTNTMVPLRAIFLLERTGDGEESSIEEVSLGKAFPFLLQQTHCPEDPDLMRKTLTLLKSLEGKVKIYKFRSSPTHDSVRFAYEMAKPQ